MLKWFEIRQNSTHRGYSVLNTKHDTTPQKQCYREFYKTDIFSPLNSACMPFFIKVCRRLESLGSLMKTGT